MKIQPFSPLEPEPGIIIFSEFAGHKLERPEVHIVSGKWDVRLKRDALGHVIMMASTDDSKNFSEIKIDARFIPAMMEGLQYLREQHILQSSSQ